MTDKSRWEHETALTGEGGEPPIQGTRKWRKMRNTEKKDEKRGARRVKRKNQGMRGNEERSVEFYTPLG
jgi:hypothetical protein